jgi:hypothetical protein
LVVCCRLCLAIIAIVRFNFDWLIICCVAIGLSSANVVGYTKCSSDAKNKAALAQVGAFPLALCARGSVGCMPGCCPCVCRV